MRPVYSIRDAHGPQTVYYRAVVQPARLQDDVRREIAPVAQPTALEGAQRVAAESLNGAARQRSSDTATLAALILKWLKETAAQGEAAFLA
jgi:hypothetical protein